MRKTTNNILDRLYRDSRGVRTYASAPKVPMNVTAAEFLAARSACSQHHNAHLTEIANRLFMYIHTSGVLLR